MYFLTFLASLDDVFLSHIMEGSANSIHLKDVISLSHYLIISLPKTHYLKLLAYLKGAMAKNVITRNVTLIQNMIRVACS